MKVVGFLLGMVLSALLSAQVPVAFKVFPRDYEVFLQGERLPYTVGVDGKRTYNFPAGKIRVSLSAPEQQPLSLQLDVKVGMPLVQAKLEPRSSLLKLVGETSVGKLPRNLAFSQDGKKLFVTLGDSLIEVYDVPSLKLAGKLLPGSGSGAFTDVQARTDRPEVWALQSDGNLQIFDAKSLVWKENVLLTGGGNAFFLPQGFARTGFYNADTGAVVSLDPVTRKVVGTISLGHTPRGVWGDSTSFYLSLFDAGSLAVVDLSTWKVRETWGAGSAPRAVAAIGDRLLVGDMSAAQLLVYSLSAKKQITSLSVGSNPHAATVSADGKWAAVASRGRNNLSDYKLAGPDFGQVVLFNAKGEVAASVWGRNQPTGLAFSPDSQYLAFTDTLDNNLELYRLQTAQEPTTASTQNALPARQIAP